MKQIVDVGSNITIVVTLVLFVIALFSTGFTHDLLLEAGVFLVSVKLIIMSYRNGQAAEAVRSELEQIRKALERLGGS